MTETQARDEICRVGKSLFDRGYVHATAGNISVRLDESEGGGFLITPTDACLGFLEPTQLARLDADARQTSGPVASKTIALHAAIYRAAATFDAQTRCVSHTHSTRCVALTRQPAGAELLPPVPVMRILKAIRSAVMALGKSKSALVAPTVLLVPRLTQLPASSSLYCTSTVCGLTSAV